ncbi:MAG: alpha-tubulin suppressor-like RCC1 family protein [Flavobacteriales bacterium]|jgi:alpha-tubulin suppressor-like RCC1 family protein
MLYFLTNFTCISLVKDVVMLVDSPLFRLRTMREQTIFPVLTKMFSLAVFAALVFVAHGVHAQQSEPMPTSYVNSHSEFESAETCAGCHQVQFEQWRSSMMSYSSISPPIHALELSENHVNRAPTADENFTDLFGFGRLSRLENPQLDADGGYTEPRLFCQKCHSPVAVFTDLFSVYKDFPFAEVLENGELVSDSRDLFPDSHSLLRQIIVDAPNTDPNNPNQVGETFDHELYRDGGPNAFQKANAKTAVEGVTCTVCHRITGQELSSNAGNTMATFSGPRPFDEPGIANSAYQIQHFLEGEAVTNFGPYNADGTPVGPPFPDDAPQAVTMFHGVGLSGVASEIPGALPDDHLIVGTDGLERPYIRTGLMCGSCHDVRIPFDDVEQNEDFQRVENLFTEWNNSAWNNNGVPFSTASVDSPFTNPREPVDTGRKEVTTCQDCHMSRYMVDSEAQPGDYEFAAITSLTNATYPSRRMTNHRFVGVDRFLTHDIPKPDEISSPNADDLLPYDVSQVSMSEAGTERPDGAPVDSFTYGDLDSESLNFDPVSGNADLREVLLQKAIDFKVESAEVNAATNTLDIAISLENVGAGHKIPSGLSQERQVWIELEVLDGDDNNIYTSGYLSPIEQVRDGEIGGSEECPLELFSPFGGTRYKDSYCGCEAKNAEYKCDLDEFRVELDPALRIVGDLVPGFDDNLRKPNDGGPNRSSVKLGLVNYQNGFRRNGQKVLTQFIGNSIDNSNSLHPFERRMEEYEVPLDEHVGPFRVNARLRFRPLPHEFLAALKNSSSQSRVTDAVIEGNRIIEMEQDACVVDADGGALRDGSVRACAAVERLAAGDFNTGCAVFSDSADSAVGPVDSVHCWGENAFGQLAQGNTSEDISSPIEIPGLHSVQKIALGAEHGCALLEDRTVSCWGLGSKGRLGDDDVTQHNVLSPKLVPGLEDVRDIDAGLNHTCAILGDAEVSCWGNGRNGRLGDGSTSAHENGVPNSIIIPGVESIAVGYQHTCVIADNEEDGAPGRIQCWGKSLGNGATVDLASPTTNNVDFQANKISSGRDFTCALFKTGKVACWGVNDKGQLGNGSTIPSADPVFLDLSRRAVDVTAGQYHACALLSDGTAECWGFGFAGRLGDGNLESHNQLTPAKVFSDAGTELSNITTLVAGGHNTCAIIGLDEYYCWGVNRDGQLGLGDLDDRAYADAPLTFSAAPDSIFIEAENYDEAPVESDAGNNGNPTQCVYKGLDVDVENSAEGTCNVGWTQANENLLYRIGSAGANYDITLRVASPNANRDISVSANGIPIGTVTTTDASGKGWQTWYNLTINNVFIASGSELQVNFDDGGVNLNHITLNKVSDGGDATDCDSASNVVPNCSFDIPTATNWRLQLNAGGSGFANYTGDAVELDVDNPGSETWSLQLVSTIALQSGSYVVSFKARADAPRSVSVNVGQDYSPYSSYGNKIFELSTQLQEYSFIVSGVPTDNNARVGFNAGNNGNATVYLDEVSIVPQ